ncbi:hypothetical protein MAP00_003210 [Monascus purpureus]|nr:hypothetical protein MAP00_003210 [Monascus purpureus]
MIFRIATRRLPLSYRGPISPSHLSRPFTSGPSDGSNHGSNSAYREGLSGFKPFVRPFAKVFLGAIFTYQVIYWTWLKLEMDESKSEKNKEVAALEKQAREMAASRK